MEMKNITKIYGNGVLANEHVNFSVRKGEIHALMGENGAGKSTLMKMIFGIEHPDEGEIFINGKQVSIKNPTDALALGIGMVHQHFMLVESLTVAENMILRCEPKKGLFLDMAKAVEEAEQIAQKYNFQIDARATVSSLPVGMKQRVEILKALYRGAEILILDEPTAVLTPQETEELFRQLKILKEKGHTIIFISHKIREIKELCDRITILRNGRSMGVYNVADVSIEDISALMVGRNNIFKIDKTPAKPRETVLKVKDLKYGYAYEKMVLNGISFSVRRGEILGIAGVEGNGQRELIEVITRLRENESGTITFLENDVGNASVKEFRNLGCGYIPQDRLTYGAAVNSTIEENLISTTVDSLGLRHGLLLKKQKIREVCQNLIHEFQVKCDSSETKVGMLSGGNMQKVVVARELTGDLNLIIADQPTRGIDIGTASFIHKKLVSLRDEGKAVLLISADLNEIMELSDSLIVIHDGQITAYFEDASKVTEHELGQYMLGVNCQSKEQIEEAYYE